MSILSRASDAYRFVRLYGQHLPLTVPAIFDVRCRVMRIEGVLRKGGSDLTIVYAGRRRNLPYLLKSTFANYRIREECRATIFGYRKIADRWIGDADLFIVDIGWPYDASINRDGSFLAMPDWISMGVDLADSWEETVRNFRRDARRNDLRLVRRNEYRCETTSSRAEMIRFYDEIYVPYTNFIHDADSLIAPRSHVVRQGCKGSLIKVMKGTDVVCAGIVVPAGDVLVSLWMGIPERLHHDRPEACISALYLFFLQYAQENGYCAVDFAGTRAFLDDGALRFKKKWGAVVEDTFSPNNVLIKLRSATPGAIAFCESMPLIARSEYGLEAVMFASNPDDETAQFSTLANQHSIVGLDRMIIFSASDREELTAVDNSPDLPIIHSKIRLDELPNVYCRRWLDSLDVRELPPSASDSEWAKNRDCLITVNEKETS